MRLRMRGAVFSYIHRVGREGGGVTYPRMMLTFIVRMWVNLRLRLRARQRTTVIPPRVELCITPPCSFGVKVLHEAWRCISRMLEEELSRVGVGCRKVSEMVGLGNVPGCRGLPVNVRKCGKGGAALFCPSPPGFSATEGKGRAAFSCCDSVGDD